MDDEDEGVPGVNHQQKIAQQIANESNAARPAGGWNRKDHPALDGLLRAARIAIYERARQSRNGRVFRSNRRLKFQYHGKSYYCRSAWPGYLVVENAARRAICASGPLVE